MQVTPKAFIYLFIYFLKKGASSTCFSFILFVCFLLFFLPPLRTNHKFYPKEARKEAEIRIYGDDILKDHQLPDIF